MPDDELPRPRPLEEIIREMEHVRAEWTRLNERLEALTAEAMMAIARVSQAKLGGGGGGAAPGRPVH